MGVLTHELCNVSVSTFKLVAVEPEMTQCFQRAELRGNIPCEAVVGELRGQAGDRPGTDVGRQPDGGGETVRQRVGSISVRCERQHMILVRMCDPN